MNTSYLNVDALKAQYAPYHTMPAFADGFADYLNNAYLRSCDYNDVDAQAYDRGVEAACRVQQAAQWIDENVGLN